MSRKVTVYCYVRIPGSKYIQSGSPWLAWANQLRHKPDLLVQADGCEFTTSDLAPHQVGEPEIHNYTERRCEGIRTLRGCPWLGSVYDRIYHHICPDRYEHAPYGFPPLLQGQQSVWATSPSLAEDYYFIYRLKRIPPTEENRNGCYITFLLVREVEQQQQQFYLLKRYDRRDCRIERITVRGDVWKYLPVYRRPFIHDSLWIKLRDFHRQLDKEKESFCFPFAVAAYEKECELAGTPEFALYRWYNPTNQFPHRIADALRQQTRKRKLTVTEEEEETETDTDDDDSASLLSV